MKHSESNYPVGARWEVQAASNGKTYWVELYSRNAHFEEWHSGYFYTLDHSGCKMDWYTSKETARRGIYLDGSQLRLVRVK